MLQNLRPMEIILIVGIIVLLFGAKKLPQLARSVGESMKIFKKEVTDVVEVQDDSPAQATASAASTQPVAEPAQRAETAQQAAAVPDLPAQPRAEQAGTPAA